MTDAVTLARTDAIGLVTINRPAVLNALDLATLDALEARIGEAAADPDIHVVVLTGAGRAFVAGGDIADLDSRQGLPHYLEFAERIHAVFRKVELLDKPTIAAINGWALGGGTELLLCTDIRIAARSAMLGLPEITLGLFPGAGGTQRMIRQLAPCQAKLLMFTGDRIPADEAARIGLINNVVDDGEAVTEAMKLAARISEKSPLTLKLLKRTLRDGLEMPPAASLRHEQAMIGLTLDSWDAHEGCAAFLARRQANFRGE